MPQRSNKFQTLVRLIQTALTCNATVEESAMLRDVHTRSLVEVDILINSSIAETPITIGIECRDRTRPATVEWVREMARKHEDLPVDKTVLVSSSGFSKEATLKAAAVGIDTLSISEAEDARWLSYLQTHVGLRANIFRFKILSTELYFGESTKLPFESQLSASSLISIPTSPNRGTIEEHAQSLIDGRGAAMIMEKWINTDQSPSEFETSIDWTPEAGTTVKDAVGNEGELERLRVKISVAAASSPITLEPARYRDANLGYAKLDDPISLDNGGELTLVVVDKSNGIGSGAVHISHTGEVKKMIRYKRAKNDA